MEKDNLNKPFSSRASYTIIFKVKVIEAYFDKFKQNASETAKFFKLDHSIVIRWIHNKDLINSHRGRNVRKIKLQEGQFPELEEGLYNWIVNKRVGEKRSIRYEDMRAKIKYLVKKSEDQSVYSKFKISSSWLSKFMERYHLSVRSPTLKDQENTKRQLEKVEIISTYIIELNKISHQYAPEFILQMDETTTYIDMLANLTVDIKGTKSVELHHTGHLKSRFTTVLTVAANGYRLPTYLILRKLKKTPKNLILNPNIVVTVSDSGFMDADLMIDYIDRIIRPYIGINKALLVLDDYRAHKTLKVIRYACSHNIQPFLIPGGFTYCLQPLDVSINKQYKDTLRRKWKSWDATSTRVTPRGNKSKPTWQQTISMVDSSVKEIQPSTIQRSFIKCGFFLNVHMDVFLNVLNDYLKKYLGGDNDDWTNEIEFFDKIQTLPKYEHQLNKPFIQLNTPEIQLTNIGEINEDNELDSEIDAIETVIAETRAWEKERESNIQGIIRTVSGEDFEIELNDDIFSL